MKKWNIAEPVGEEARATYPELSRALLQLLWNRGLRTQDEIDVFLGPDWSRDTHDPFLFRQMREACERTFQAIDNGELIAVHGDYDADGVCASTLVVSALRELASALGTDVDVRTYIPHREKEGYGMSVPTMETLADEGAKLVITVDCGISNKDAIDRGKELGVETIVCDHHEMPADLPEAYLIHPLVPGETYPFKNLCGTGVAFKFASGLYAMARERGAEIPEGQEKWLLDLVAIATVTDVMPLIGENRVLERYGLIVLNKTKRPGLRALIDVSRASLGTLDTYAIGFQLGPRINAAGRMRHASDALELLLEENEDKAAELAAELDQVNRDRRSLSDKMYEEAVELIGEVGEAKALIVAKEGWMAGLVGLVAGKIVRRYGVPAYVVGKDGDKHVGSGRSVEGFNVTEGLRAAAEYLDKFGGHPQACGFSVMGEERYEKAVEAMRAYAREQLAETDLRPVLYIDAEIEAEEANWELVDDLDRLRPFGEANRQPLFLTHGLTVIGFDTVGSTGAHLRLRLRGEGGKTVKAIAFGMGHRVQELSLGCQADIVYRLSVNEWNGNREIQFELEDVRVV
jgi:single-stranded-DNA-specific exonuclease